jgi:hypothetical protein
MEKFIVTFGYQQDGGEYVVQSSKPIPAKDEQEASWILKDQFESFEGEECNIISITKTN